MVEQSPHAEFTLQGGNADAVIFVHGICGSPVQFRPMAEFMFNAGYDCKALLLPGHGSDASAFCRTPYGAWKNHITQSINATAKQYSRVFLVGHSLGGLLCLDYASTHSVSGLVLINTPLAFKFSPIQITLCMRVLLSRQEKDNELLSAYRQSTGIDWRCKWYEYALLPGQFVNLLRQMRGTGKVLNDVNTPTRIVQSGKDESVRLKSARVLQAGLPGVRGEVLWLENSYHGYFPKEENRILLDAILCFCRIPET